jgi:hypothetical protein
MKMRLQDSTRRRLNAPSKLFKVPKTSYFDESDQLYSLLLLLINLPVELSIQSILAKTELSIPGPELN